MRLRKSRSRIARTLSWSSTYSRIDSSGSIEIDQRFSSISTSWKPTSVWSKIREAFSCEETSQTIVRLPSAAARRPSATATVVLPTPPLPVTKTSRLSRSSGIGQFLAISRRGRKSGRPCEYPRNGIPQPQDQVQARTVVDEPHPIVEELEQMEEAVPERPDDDPRTRSRSARGSCRGGRAPRPRKPRARTQPPTPPAEERLRPRGPSRPGS